MILALLLLGAALLALPGVYQTPPRRLPLNEWVPVAAAALMTGFLALEISLVFVALPTVSHALGVAGVIDTCHDVLAPIPRDPSVVGWLALALAATLALRFAVGIAHAAVAARAAYVEPWLGRHAEHGEFDLVVVPTDGFLAFGVPGSAPQIVVSEGLVEHLPPELLDAVVRHEVAHHRLGHMRYLRLLAGLERALGGLPVVARSTRIVRDGLEVWADGEAGEGSPALRRALAETAVDTGRLVADRIERLRQAAPPRPTFVRAAAYAPAGLLAVTSAFLVVAWMTGAQHALALGLPCAS